MMLRTVALLGIFAFQTVAAQLGPPQDLPAAIQRQIAARETLKTQAEEGYEALRKWYEASLDAIRLDAANKADLDLVLATDAERGRMERDLTPEESAALPKLLRDLRTKYDQGRVQRQTQYKAALIASLREYKISLEALEKSLTRKLDVDAAVAARKERLATGDEMNALSAPGVVVNLAPATAATTPAPAAPAPSAPPATPAPAASIRSGPYVRPTRPAPVKVASEIRAYGTIQSPSADAIPFQMSPTAADSGPPADGGRGVLLKNDPAAGRNGTTWSLKWTYDPASFYGVTLVHPYGNGHVMVRLRSSRCEPVSTNGWEIRPFNAGGSTTFFKTTEGVPDPFPLQPNRKYAIVTNLDEKGHFTLTVDGQVVRTGEYGPQARPHIAYAFPNPITLPAGLRGDRLPMKWEAGYAGLLVWPTTTGASSLCEDITFQVGAPTPALSQAAPVPAPPVPSTPPAPPRRR
jgi:hypothetical protein